MCVFVAGLGFVCLLLNVEMGEQWSFVSKIASGKKSSGLSLILL